VARGELIQIQRRLSPSPEEDDGQPRPAHLFQGQFLQAAQGGLQAGNAVCSGYFIFSFSSSAVKIFSSSSSQEIFERLWIEFLLDQPEQVDPSQEFDSGLVIGGASLDDQLARDLTGLNLSHDPALPPPVEFVTAFTSCTTILRGATWNCQQLRFIFDEKRLDSVAHYLSNSFDLVFLQEIPPGDSGQYRLRQLVRTMNAGSPLNEPRFSYLLGRETVVLDTTSQLNAIIYPTSWKVLRHISLTNFLHPPIMA